jgi:pimeloyl-ACP methyl ester carboxylesterase
MARRSRYGLRSDVTVVAGRPVRSLTSGLAGRFPDVVFVPGMGILGYLAPWTRASGRWTRATLLDLPGWRFLGRPACPPDALAVGSAVAGWLQARAGAPVVLVGHSTGAQSALRAAVEAPDRVRGLLLANPVFDPADRRWRRLIRRCAAGAASESWGIVPVALPSILGSRGVGMLAMLAAALTNRPEELPAAVPTADPPPTHVVTSADDRVAPVSWSATVAERVGADLEIVPGSHNWCWNDPACADRVLRAAMERLLNGSGGR